MLISRLPEGVDDAEERTTRKKRRVKARQSRRLIRGRGEKDKASVCVLSVCCSEVCVRSFVVVFQAVKRAKSWFVCWLVVD